MYRHMCRCAHRLVYRHVCLYTRLVHTARPHTHGPRTCACANSRAYTHSPRIRTARACAHGPRAYTQAACRHTARAHTHGLHARAHAQPHGRTHGPCPINTSHAHTHGLCTCTWPACIHTARMHTARTYTHGPRIRTARTYEHGPRAHRMKTHSPRATTQAERMTASCARVRMCTQVHMYVHIHT
jgi:hypothetical protein